MPEDATGTTPSVQDGGSTAEAVTGTPAPAGADGSAEGGSEHGDDPKAIIAEKDRKIAQLLAEKSNTERIRAEAERRMAGPSPTTAQPDPYQQAIQTAWNDLQMRANQGDPDAIMTVTSVNGQMELERKVQRKLDLMELPKDMRSEVEAELDRKPYLSVQDAVDVIEGRTSRSHRAEIEAKEAKLREEQDKHARGVVSTGKRPLTQTELAKTDSMQKSEYFAELDRLERAGKWSERGDIIDRKNSGKLKLRE